MYKYINFGEINRFVDFYKIQCSQLSEVHLSNYADVPDK